MAQFISERVGLVSDGKKAMTKATNRSAIENRLSGKPNLPMEKYDSNMVPVHRRYARHEMQVMYEVNNATVPIEMMISYATNDPMLMQDNKQENVAVQMTALIGISHPTGTFEIHDGNGTAPSRANANSCREAPAIMVKLAEILRMMMIDISPLAALVELVAL